MGNLIVSEKTMSVWREESKTAASLARLEPYNPQEEALINSVLTEASVKTYMSLFLGIAFSASLRRYFPGIPLTESTFIFSLASVGIIFSTCGACGIYINREVVARLTVIKNNHKIIES